MSERERRQREREGVVGGGGGRGSLGKAFRKHEEKNRNYRNDVRIQMLLLKTACA